MMLLWFLGALVFGMVFNAYVLLAYFVISAVISMSYIINDEVKFEALLK